MKAKPLHNVLDINPALRGAGLDAAVVMSTRNLFLLTGYPRATWQRPGYRRSACAIAYPGAEPTLVTGRAQEEIALIRGWAQDVTTYTDYVESPLARAAEVLRTRGFATGRIGVEERWIPAEFYDDLAKGLPGAELVACDELLAATWARKTPEEVAVLQDGQRRLGEAVDDALSEAHGKTEEAIHQSVLSRILQSGTQTGWGQFEAGRRRAYRDLRVGDRNLEPSALLTIEYGCTYQQYSAHVVRTGSAIKPRPSDAHAYDKYTRAVREALGHLKARQTGAEAFEVIRAALASEGLALSAPTVGHALGIGFTERPELHPSEELTLEAGMLLCIEPTTTTGIRASTTVLITADEGRVLPEKPESGQLLVVQG